MIGAANRVERSPPIKSIVLLQLLMSCDVRSNVHVTPMCILSVFHNKASDVEGTLEAMYLMLPKMHSTPLSVVASTRAKALR